MALPVGVTTATVVAGVPVSFVGSSVKAFVSIEPSVFLVHAATGTPIVDFLEESATVEGVSVQFTLPHTDQAGFIDENGNAYTNWYYTARITYSTPSKAKDKAPKLKVFQLTTGQTTVDLDLLPGGAPALPYIAPTATVTAFEGRTGPITFQESDLPDRLDVASLNATFARVFTPESYGAVADGKKVTSGVMSASSTTLTSSAGLFTAGDVGKRIVIRGAGTAGVALGTTISGYTSATQVTLATPAVTAVSNVNVEWGTDDSAALQAALTAANDASGTLRLMGGRTYVTGAQLNMTDKAVRIEFQPGSKILAAAAMTTVLHRPDGGPGTNTVLEQPVIDGGGVAERCLDVLRCHYFVINGGAMENATVAVADFGRTGSQCYEIEWNGGLVTGMSSSGGVPVSARPAHGIRSGVSTTDSNFMDLKVKNAANGVQDLGQANIWQGVHVYHYPFRLTSGGADWGEDATGFDVQGPHNRLISCYADTCETGFNLNGEFSEVTDSKLLWPSIHAPLYTPVGVKILKPGCIVVNNQWYPGNPAEQDVIGIEVGATAWKPIIIGNTFGGGATGYAAGAPIVNLGAPDGVRYGNMWDGGVLTDFSNNHWLSTIFTDLGNANDVLFRWYGTNPGRMIAVGSGSTGYIRFLSDTADGGLMFGATGNKVGFTGAAPVVRQDGNTDLQTVLERFGLVTASTVRPHRTGLNPRTADTSITTQAGEIQSVDAVAGPVSITLPATATPGHSFIIKKTDASANAVTVVGTIDGVANYSLPARWNFVRVVSTSTSGSWLIVAKG